jgi:hypothetical protein
MRIRNKNGLTLNVLRNYPSIPYNCQIDVNVLECRTNDKDDPRPSRPISSSSEKDIGTIKVIVVEDVRYIVEEISDTSGLTDFHLERIITKRKVYSRWIPD